MSSLKSGIEQVEESKRVVRRLSFLIKEAKTLTEQHSFIKINIGSLKLNLAFAQTRVLNLSKRYGVSL